MSWVLPGSTRTVSISIYDDVQAFNYARAGRTAGLLLVFLGSQDAARTAPHPALGNAVALASGLFYALLMVSRFREELAAGAPARDRTVLDVRGLEPPQPMVRVLEEIDRLGPGAELEVHHERRPMFLYPQLDERGLIHETDEPEPGLVRILIRRGPA